MHTLAVLSAAAALVVPSLASVLPRRDAGLKVELSQVRATEVNAVLTNTGNEPLKLLDFGTLMDKNPVQKLNIYKDGEEVEFTGIDVRYQMWDFPEEAFTTLQAGESFASVVNIAALHAVGGGDYTVSTKGAIPYAVIGTTELAGSVLYESNVLELTLSEEDTSVVERAVPLDILEKRTRLSRCSGNNDAEHRASLQNVVSLASQAAGAARSGSAARFQTWFKTTDQTTRNTVAARFEAVSREASTTTSGATTYACVDPYGYCSPNVLAYALPSQNFISNCPIYYDLPLLSRNCGQQDQTTTALHEFTHTPGVFAPGTQDNAYGTRASQALSAGQALNNADTFALFANSVLNNC